MSSIFILTTAAKTRWSPYALSDYERLLRAANSDHRRRHCRVGTPEEADLVLFVASRYRFHADVLSSQVYKRYRNKCLIFDLQDGTIPLLPGLYMSIPARLRPVPVYEHGFYPRVFDNSMLKVEPHHVCEHLFSFVGAVANCPRIRRQVISLDHPRALLRDASSGQSDGDPHYVETLQRSKFILCPRGKGASTWRCFEAMKAGRVPVIISDGWDEPPGVDWSEFSIRVGEGEIEGIPRRLEAAESKAIEMGKAARSAWEEHFALETCFDWIAERCVAIQQALPEYKHVVFRNRWRESLALDHFGAYWKEILREKLLRA